MSRAPRSLEPAYFEALYAADPDPWRFADSDYEREKYAATLAALPRARYARALEVGCSIGVLTRALADRCDQLLALDVAEAALAAARARCADRPHVDFRRQRVPMEWPEDAGPFDLLLLSEVVYYLDAAGVDLLAARCLAATAAGADLLLVHYVLATDYPLSGDTAAERFIAAAMPAVAVTRQTRTDGYRLDLLRRR